MQPERGPDSDESWLEAEVAGRAEDCFPRGWPSRREEGLLPNREAVKVV